MLAFSPTHLHSPLPYSCSLESLPKQTTHSHILASGSALGNPSKTQPHLPSKEAKIPVAEASDGPQELALDVAGRIMKEEEGRRGGWESKRRGGTGWQSGSRLCSVTAVTDSIISLHPTVLDLKP